MIKVQDSLLTKDECDQIINYTMSEFHHNFNYTDIGQYHYVQLMRSDESFETKFSNPVLQPAYNAIINLKNLYIEEFPEVQNLDAWNIEYVRFKRWKPDNSFGHWHSEHNTEEPNRVMSFMIYLSDNDCSTNFRRHDSVKTKAGRGLMFPAYFTHEHCGEVCREGLDRYVLSGYYCFVGK